MNEILTYLDDLNVLDVSFEDHLENLRESFMRYMLKLQPIKCTFFQTEEPFLGKLATTEGIAVDPSKMKAVIEWVEPTCTQKLESFLGFTNYHQQRIKNYSDKAASLYEFTGSTIGLHGTEVIAYHRTCASLSQLAGRLHFRNRCIKHRHWR